MIKAVIFDLNGVFIRSPKLSDRFREVFSVPEDVFVPVLKEILAKVRLPNAGDAFSYWQPYLETWSVPLDKTGFFDFWFSAEKEVTEMVELARELKSAGKKIFILSNNFSERTAYYEENFPFLKDIANTIYYSWQTGFVKPSVEAYTTLLNESGLLPDECAYFDDSGENVEVAASLGIASFVFEGVTTTRSLLAEK